MTQRTWILTCNASRARLLLEKQHGRDYSLVGSYEHADSRAHVRDLMADAQGRKPVGPVPAAKAASPGGGYGRPGAEPDTDPKEVEAQKFAHELAAMLEKGRSDHVYERLIVVAPPHFLGLMRSALDGE